MNRRMTARIADDMREEFGKLRVELGHYTEPEADVDQARRILPEHAPTMVLARTQLLLDTLLNYLMEDAEAALADASTEIQIEFYDIDLRGRVKKSFALDPESLKLSFDPRLIAGGIAAGAAATAGSLATALFLFGLISRIAGGVATLVATALAFKIAYDCRPAADWTRKRLEKDVDEYITLSEQQVSSWLASVEEFFVVEFKKFRDGEGRLDGGMA